ncbi:MAG: response regulator [Verrucomicrobia bacterium]|nr:response regulator [Verrucomicrobiota bacterium]
MKSLNFRIALVIAHASSFRNAVAQALRNQGWLVHAIQRAEQTFQILAHIPYELIVIDSDLSGMPATDFVRILYNSRDWKAIRVVVISHSHSAEVDAEARTLGVFMSRDSEWKENSASLLSFLNENLVQKT